MLKQTNTPHSQTEAQTSLPEPKDAVCFVPSQFFFFEVLSIDSELSTAERDDFIQLQIETLSPFPIEQIVFGYYIVPNTQYCVLYSALKDRLEAENFESLDSYTWVLPDFITALVEKTEHLQSKTDISETLLGFQPENKTIELQKDCSFSIQTPNGFSEEKNSLDLDTLWAADIRTQAFKEKTKKDRSRLAFLNKTFLYSLYFIAVLILAELALVLATNWLSGYASTIEKQAVAVSRIEDQHTLIHKLEQIAQNELRPISLLERANAVRTLSGSNIVYDDVDIIGENEVTIKGTAGSVNQFNKYVSQLENSGYFVISEDPKYVTRGGKTTFTLKMNYQHSKIPNT